MSSGRPKGNTIKTVRPISNAGEGEMGRPWYLQRSCAVS